jgi:hypothetical protein
MTDRKRRYKDHKEDIIKESHDNLREKSISTLAAGREKKELEWSRFVPF